jgi:ABC-type sugar transport system ATPase subunit
VIGNGRVALAPFVHEPLTAGTKITVGVRPEHLVIDREGTVEGTVRAVEWLGHERHVVCDVAGTDITVREPSDRPAPAAGEAVKLRSAPEHVHLFDPSTTERLN